MKTNESAQSEDLLLKLFREHVKKQLREKIKDTIESEINAAIDGAVASLRAHIQTEYDESTRALRAVVITREVQ